jgi:hypothetical protein
VSDNVITNPTNFGIIYNNGYVNGTSSLVDLVVKGNQISGGGGGGILVYGPTGSNVTSPTPVIVSDNLVDGCGQGINVQFLNNLVVSSNVVVNSTSEGMYAQNCVDATFSANQVTKSAAQGLVLINYTRHIVIGNNLSNNATYGLYLVGTSPSGTFIGNRIYQNGSGPIVDGTSTPMHRYVENQDLTNSTVANNRGTVTIGAGSTSAAVTFPTAEGDAKYLVLLGGAAPLSGGAGQPAWYTNKATTGFTVNVATAAPSGGLEVDWAIVR